MKIEWVNAEDFPPRYTTNKITQQVMEMLEQGKDGFCISCDGLKQATNVYQCLYNFRNKFPKLKFDYYKKKDKIWVENLNVTKLED